MKDKGVAVGYIVAAIVVVIVIIAAAVVVTLPREVAPPAGPEAPAAIKFGHTGPFTGVLATAESICQTFYNLWTEQANAQGGLYLSEYNTRVPVNWVLYNDMADTGRAATNVEKLITEDNVAIIYGSYGTFQGFAQHELVNNLAAQGYKTIYMVGNGTCVLWDTAEDFYEYYWQNKIYTDSQGRPWYTWEYTLWTEMPRAFHMEALVDVLEEVGVQTVVVWKIGTLYGIESMRFLEYLLENTNIRILDTREYPLEITDFTSLITAARALDPDAIIQFSYPGDGMKSIEDMIALNYNPKLFYNALGVTSGEAYTKFGKNLNGIMYHSTAFPKSPMSNGMFGTGMELLNAYVERYGMAPDVIDGAIAYATVEVMGTLIERAGSLDKAKIYQEVIKAKDNPIPTVIGPVYWERGPWPELPGVVGQHIGTTDTSLGEDCEIVGAAFGERVGLQRTWNKNDWVTHAPVYPKPAWS
ncbi:MAG: ABC transporter substrate-binding protein [Candidatus Hadarchaeales archaeon]